MSTYGTTAVVDSGDESGLLEAARSLAAQDADVYRSTSPDGLTRIVVSLDAVEQLERFANLLGTLGTGRAAVAEDNDEYGAAWTVLSVADGSLATVHRRYVLNARPGDDAEVALAIQDLGADPRAQDVAGEQAATAAAELFGLDPAPVVDAERRSDRAWEELGTVGGPFPWWSAMRLPWPGPDAGEPVAPDPDAPGAVRMNLATWPRFAREHVVPRLLRPDDWEVTHFGALRGTSTWLAQGLTWSGSSSPHFDVYAWVMPLYLPAEHIHQTWTRRLQDPGGRPFFDLPSRDTADRIGAEVAAAVTSQGLDHLDRVGTLDGFAHEVSDFQESVRADTGFRGAKAEELGYTLLLLGREREAAAQLRAASRRQWRVPEWQHESRRRASSVARLMARDPQRAIDQLDAWAQQTADRLGISRVPLR